MSNIGLKNSAYLTRKDVAEHFRSGFLSYIEGFPFTRYTVIQGVTKQQLQLFFHKYDEWILKETGSSARYNCTYEAPPIFSHPDSFHANILHWLPTELNKPFDEKWKVKWLEDQGIRVTDETFNSDSRFLQYSQVPNLSNPKLYLKHGLIGVTRYVCTGAHPAVAAEYGIKNKFEGIIPGKRRMQSESLSKNASYDFSKPEKQQRFRDSESVCIPDSIPIPDFIKTILHEKESIHA